MAGLSCDYRTWACENLYGVVESSVIRICDSGSAHCTFLRYLSKLVAYHLLIIRLIIGVNYDVLFFCRKYSRYTNQDVDLLKDVSLIMNSSVFHVSLNVYSVLLVNLR